MGGHSKVVLHRSINREDMNIIQKTYTNWQWNNWVGFCLESLADCNALFYLVASLVKTRNAIYVNVPSNRC